MKYYPNSDVVGVFLDRRAYDRGTERWRATAKINGIRKELYYGESMILAEEARWEFDRTERQERAYNKKHSEYFCPTLWADWPASKLSWESK